MPIYDTSDEILLSGTDGADVIYRYPESTQAPSEVIAAGLYRPLFATAPAGDTDRLFVVSQGGVINIHDLNDPQAEPQVFLNLGGIVNNNTEAGLLGFTFHPDFATNGKCYVNYTTPDTAEGTGRKQAIVEYTFDPNNLSTPPTSETIMMIDYPQEHTHHRAGWLDFGPDGMLYIATGEDTVASNAQTVVNQDGSINHLGKILRIDVSGDDFPEDADRNYSIPDNPLTFDNIQGTLQEPSEIWAVGLRNPWRASFGPDGKLYVADVGQNTYEEINIVEAGKNYGWREAQVADGPQNTPGYTDPYYYYGRDVGGSVTGGYFYEGPGPLNGKYIFGDFNVGKIFAMDVSGDEPVVEDITNLFRDANGNPMQFGHLSSFGLDGRGNLYAISYADGTWGNDTGQIFRLSDSTPITDGPDSIEAGGGDDVVYAGAGNDTIHGGGGNDHLYGEADDDHLYGDAGTDTLEGGAGNDTYYVDGDDTVVEAGNGGIDTVVATESYTLGANVENLILRGTAIEGAGNSLDNVITGNGAGNFLFGLGGADTLIGGAGDDIYVVDGSDTVTEAEGEGIDTVEADVSYTLGANVEDLILVGSAANGTGNELANSITGNDAANILNGAAGADTLYGLAGNDTLQGGDGNDTIHAGDDDDQLHGEADADELYGDAGADTLDGGAGADTLWGGAGDDTYILNDDDRIVEDADQGIDTVKTTLNTYTLGANLENLTLLGTAETGRGNDLDNHIIGNDEVNFLNGEDGADTLDGGAGNDGLTGGAGNDTYIVDGDDMLVEAANGGTDTVRSSVTHTLGDNFEHLVLTGTAAVNGTGNGLDNEIIGNSAANVLNGDAGVDTLRGGGGIDTLTGGAGDDEYHVETGDRVVEEANGGTDTIRAATSFTLQADSEVEFIWAADIASTAALNLTGNAFAQMIVGNAGANVLNGGGGSDTLGGLGGNDTYYVDDANNIVRELQGQGTDTVIASAHYKLAAATTSGTGHVEILKAASGTKSINLTGNELSNTMSGNSGKNRIDGGSGHDTVSASSGNDRLYGETGNDSLVGGSGNDSLSGSSGNDKLSGGSGKDTLSGGSGRDTFIFNDKETGSSKTKADYISDFSGRSRDKIDLELVDANTKKSGDQDFSFIGTKAFSKAGEVRYEKTKGYTYVYLNTDNDKSAEAVIKLKGAMSLSKSWFDL